MANTDKKDYTFISAAQAHDDNGDFVHATLIGFATRPEAKKSEKAPVTASLAINNRAKTINKLLGTSFDESGDKPIWVRLNFWSERDQENFLKFMNGRSSAKVAVGGKLVAREYNGNTSLDLNVQTWTSIWTGSTKTGSGNGGNTAPAAPKTAAQTGGFTEIGEDDGELPF